MLSKRLITIGVLAVCAVASTNIRAAELVPFKGTWTGLTLSADPTNFPIISIVSAGGGTVSHLGEATMISPHTTDVFTGDTAGDQIFTAANGDTLTAFCAGFPAFQPDGTVVGSLECDITAGTGRFEGATGSYVFFLVATPLPGPPGTGFATEAQIDGQISF